MSRHHSPLDLKLLNQCRLYLQVYSLTDITSADGKEIIPHYKNGVLGQDRISSLQWPTQQRPGKQAWSLWQKALLHFKINGQLAKPLGKWTTSPHQVWHWYMDPISSILYKKTLHQWFHCKPLIRPSTRTTRSQTKALYQITNVSPSTEPPHNLLPVTITNDHITALATATHSSSIFQVHPHREVSSNELYTLITTSPFYTRLLGPFPNVLKMDVSASNLITQHDIYLGTDGSFDPITSTGAHGWVIANKDSTLWEGAGPSDGHYELMSPYRAELSGIVAGLHILK